MHCCDHTELYWKTRQLRAEATGQFLVRIVRALTTWARESAEKMYASARSPVGQGNSAPNCQSACMPGRR